MNTYTLYLFKFWRYLIIAVGLVLLLVFGGISLALRYSFDFGTWDEISILLLTFVSLALSIIFGAKVSTYTCKIQVSTDGLMLTINSPIPFTSTEFIKITWDDLDAFNIEGDDQGDVLTFKVRGTGKEYRFTNSIFKKSQDMQPFFEALKKGADVFNEQHFDDHKHIGELPGFYSGTFALVSAIFLAVLMFIIPIMIYLMSSNEDSVFPYLKLIWFYLLSMFIIRNVYVARKTNH